MLQSFRPTRKIVSPFITTEPAPLGNNILMIGGQMLPEIKQIGLFRDTFMNTLSSTRFKVKHAQIFPSINSWVPSPKNNVIAMDTTTNTTQTN